MSADNDAQIAIRIVGELLTFGERAIALRLRKERPEITESEIAAEVARWYLTRPGAEMGDCEGSFEMRTLE